jgi:hypothetical protein
MDYRLQIDVQMSGAYMTGNRCCLALNIYTLIALRMAPSHTPNNTIAGEIATSLASEPQKEAPMTA